MREGLDITLSAAFGICRLFIGHPFLVLSSTPLVLALFSCVIILLVSGIKLWINYGLEAPLTLPLGSLYYAIDVVLFCLSLNRVHPVAFTFFQVLSLVTLQNSNRINKTLAVILAIAGCAVFPSLKLLDLVLVIASCIAAVETARMRQRYSATIEGDQAEFFATLALGMLLVLTSADAVTTFAAVIRQHSLVAVLAIGAAGAFVCYRRWDSDEPKGRLLSFAALAALTALTFLRGTDLWRAVAALLLAALAAYLSLPKVDSTRLDPPTRARVVGEVNTSKLIVVLGFTLVVLALHVNSFNPELALFREPALTNGTRTPTSAPVTSTKQPVTVPATGPVMSVDPSLVALYNDRAMSDGVRKQLRLQCLHKTKDLITRTVALHIRPKAPFTLLDYPVDWNLGDSLIYAGTELVWHIYGQNPVHIEYPYVDVSALQQGAVNLTGGVVFVPGGGNFGDIGGAHQALRVNLARGLPAMHLVYLPQSITYTEPANIVADNAVFAAHKHLTMMFRDYHSLAFARTHFPETRSLFVPDMAFMLGAMVPNSEPVVDILFLLRYDAAEVLSDRGRATALARDHSLTAELWDFPVGGFPNRTASGDLLWDYQKILPGRVLSAHSPYSDALIAYRVQLASSLLSRGRVVVTDRLHASIVSSLIDRPVIYIDSAHEKITDVRGSLKQSVPECTDAVFKSWAASSLVEAVELVADVLGE